MITDRVLKMKFYSIQRSKHSSTKSSSHLLFNNRLKIPLEMLLSTAVIVSIKSKKQGISTGNDLHYFDIPHAKLQRVANRTRGLRMISGLAQPSSGLKLNMTALLSYTLLINQ
jgi:hypothetical protein